LYIWQQPDWPTLTWDQAALAPLLSQVSRAQGKLLGKMEALGFDMRNEANLQTLTQDVIKSSEIEGENLEPDEVRSSIARRLGMDIAGLVPSDRNVDGVVSMTLDATGKYDKALTVERLHGWHATLFPTGYSGMHKISVAKWRNDGNGRIARAIADMALSRSDESQQRFYSMSGQIRNERKDYYHSLEWTQKGELDVTR
jgi:Fic family protein